MAKIISETPTFDLSIVVPEGGDSRVDAAEKVEAIAQKLANRSQFLKAITDVAARRNTTNTFTQANTFTQPITATSIAASGTVAAAALTSSATSTLNGLIVSNDLVVGDDIAVTDSVILGGLLAVGGNAEVSGDVFIDGSIRELGPIQTRSLRLALSNASIVQGGNAVRSASSGGNDIILANGVGATGYARLAFQVPTGNKLRFLDFQVQQADAGAIACQVFARNQGDWSVSPGAVTITPLGSPASTAVTGSLQTVTIDLGSHDVVNATESYIAEFIFLSGVSNSNSLRDVRLRVDDYFTRNW